MCPSCLHSVHLACAAVSISACPLLATNFDGKLNGSAQVYIAFWFSVKCLAAQICIGLEIAMLGWVMKSIEPLGHELLSAFATIRKGLQLVGKG